MVKKGIQLIAEEIERVRKSGGSDELLESEYPDGTFSSAAAYHAVGDLIYTLDADGTPRSVDTAPVSPWDAKWRKKTAKMDPIERLVIAGYLIVTEIDKLIRSREDE